MKRLELQSIQRLQQKLHRKELALARLKGKQRKKQLAETRLKIRLGHLLHLCNLHHQHKDIESTLVKTVGFLKNQSAQELELLQTEGDELLSNSEISTGTKSSQESMSSEAIRELRDEKISLGNLMMNYDFQHHSRSIIFAALNKIVVRVDE